MDFYYYETYLLKIISRAARYSFSFIGGAIQAILNIILIIYYFRSRANSSDWDNIIMVTMILIFVFLFVFLMNLLQEFRWAVPDIIFTCRPQLLPGGKIMVVLDIKNNEYDELKDCYLKLNKYIATYPELPLNKKTIPEHLSEQFVWQNGEEKIEIPSLETRTVDIAKENPKISDMPNENFFLGLCTNTNRIIYPEQSSDKEMSIVLIDFEAELRGKLGERRIFPKKFCGRIIFKKHPGSEVFGNNLRPVAWLDLQEIESRKTKKMLASY